MKLKRAEKTDVVPTKRNSKYVSFCLLDMMPFDRTIMRFGLFIPA